MSITGGELVVLALKKHNIKKVFGLVGNHLSPILVHSKKHKLEIIDVRHEQAAIHMADGYSQVTRKPGVAMVVGGPGFTNSITGIVKAYMANTPMLVIVGAPVPQQRDIGGLQDMNQIAMVKEYTKWSATIYDTSRIPEYIEIALKKAVSGKMGPVVLEIPISILKAVVNEDAVKWPANIANLNHNCADIESMDKVLEIILNAKRPIIIAGDEVYYANAEEELKNFVEEIGIPLYTVNKARGCVPDQHKLCFGNGRVLEAGPQLYALKNADCIINVGLYIDYQMGFCKPPFFCESQVFINICRDVTYNSEFTSQQGISIAADPCKTLAAITKRVNQAKKPDFSVWINDLTNHHVSYWENLYNLEKSKIRKIHPIKLIKSVIENVKEDSVIVLDGSNAMFWGGLLFECNYPGQMIIGPDGTLGPMGCGVPLALAAKLEYPDKDVILYTGDGSFGFNAIEMDTAVRFNIPLTVVVHNDMSWGFCKSTQVALYGEENTAASDLGIRRYDKMVEAIGGFGEFVETDDRMDAAIKNALASGVASCVNVLVDEDALAPGAIMFNESLKIMK